MATKAKAIEYAQDAQKRTGKEYVITQSRNGQWLYGPKEFYDSPLGRILLEGRTYQPATKPH